MKVRTAFALVLYGLSVCAAFGNEVADPSTQGCAKTDAALYPSAIVLILAADELKKSEIPRTSHRKKFNSEPHGAPSTSPPQAAVPGTPATGPTPGGLKPAASTAGAPLPATPTTETSAYTPTGVGPSSASLPASNPSITAVASVAHADLTDKACKSLDSTEKALKQIDGKNVWSDRLGSLMEAARFEHDWSLADARRNYGVAMTSKAPAVAKCAALRYEDVAIKEAGMLWPLRWFEPVAWFMEKPSKALVYCSVPGAFLVFILYAWLDAARRGIHLSAPVCVGGKLPIGVFAEELRAAMIEVRSLIESEISGHQMSGSVALSLSSNELSKDVIDALPKVLGVDVGKIIPALLSAYRYFFIKLETSVATSGTEIRCYSSLRRAWRTLECWNIQVPIAAGAAPAAVPIAEIALAARRVAYRASAWCADPDLGSK
jgi:hypothetical protein